MLLFLLGVLCEFFLHRLTHQSGCAYRMELVAQDAHDLGGHCVVQHGDGGLDLATVVVRHRPFGKVLPRLARISLMSAKNEFETAMTGSSLGRYVQRVLDRRMSSSSAR